MLGKIFKILVVVIIGFSALMVFLVSKEIANPPVQPEIAQPILSPEEQEKQRLEQEKAQAEWAKTKGGQICAKNKGWTKQECDDLVANKIWVGMKYDMLVYMRGKPNSVNPSDYGGGIQYQYCWNNYTPRCFYDQNGDSIIDAFN